MVESVLQTPIEFLKGVGPSRAALLTKETGIRTFRDLLYYFPFRYEDRTRLFPISSIHEDMPSVQLIGWFHDLRFEGQGLKKRLIGYFSDETGMVEVVWFSGIQYWSKQIQAGKKYLLFGKPALFKNSLSIAHPEFELYDNQKPPELALSPVYRSSLELKKSRISNKMISNMLRQLLQNIKSHLPESLPDYLIRKNQLVGRYNSFWYLHFPANQSELAKGLQRQKYEEIFYAQLKALMLRTKRRSENKGFVFTHTTSLKEFYVNHLPFELTSAQKRVIKEIHQDLRSGLQMNRLLQGDVGSGKTMVAFCSILLAQSNGYQSCIMAPTEILAEQHFKTLSVFCEQMGLTIGLLTGSTKKAERQKLLAMLEEGACRVMVGTHALLEDPVVFHSLGLCIIDEQHKFGVAQRARLWKKSHPYEPHILVMTATPIPRTLAMTVYGDLDVSVIDELPLGRKPIITVLRFDPEIQKVFGFVKEQLAIGRQAYIVYPLIEESESLDLKNLMEGYEEMKKVFKEYSLAMVHGRMKSNEKEKEMTRFSSNEAQVLVSTTVVEVGVNVANASIMLIQNAERFGLAQLHQLRGRVGRGSDQSYCILMAQVKASEDSKKRLKLLCSTNDGFKIAQEDLSLRGPGDVLGTLQSGLPDFKLTDFSADVSLFSSIRSEVEVLLEHDPQLRSSEHQPILDCLQKETAYPMDWAKIS